MCSLRRTIGTEAWSSFAGGLVQYREEQFYWMGLLKLEYDFFCLLLSAALFKTRPKTGF